ncbi:MAG: hypothetical protein HFJ17_01445 [Clostridia bacterium]|nr:hypothetical protein [Clostridia bacterium]
MTKTLKKAIDIEKSGELTVKVTNSEIEITGGGLNGTEIYELPDEKGAGFGFFSEHFDHNCNRIGSFKLEGINLETTYVRKIEEVLREPDWREGTVKVLVNVNDKVNEQLNNPASQGELLTRMLSDEIYYVAWGKSVNQSQNNSFIAANNGKGKFINNTNYNNSINQTAQYIKSLMPTNDNSNYVILNENTVLSSTNANMNNTAGGEYPNGRWLVKHDCEYYENNIGQFASSGKYMSDMITSFDKTGKYEIFYEDNPVNPAIIYVHRRPVAEMSITRSGNNVTLTSLSYDLDKQSDNNGIKSEEWKYKKVGDTNWTNGKLTNISSGNDFLVSLRVQDHQDTWSAPVTKYITKTSSVAPIASFEIKNKNTSIYETLEIVDGSYDPYGGTITKREWTVKKGNTQVYSGSSPLTNYNQSKYGIGNYTMSLKVTNNRGQESEVFSRNFEIIRDNEAPEFTATPIESDWTKSVDVELKFKDRLGSGFKNYQYAITDSQDEPTSWSAAIAKANDTITINQDGIKYLHIKAVDNAGNRSETRAVGPYKIDRTAPEPTIEYDDNWSIDYVTIHWEFEDTQSGMKHVILPDGSTTTSTSGDYIAENNKTYTFKAYDKLDNIKTETVTINNIDTTPPTVALSRDNTNLTDGPIKIHWYASDSQSGFNKIVLPDGTSSNNANGDFEVSQMGKYTFIAYDNVGNDMAMSIIVDNVDMKIPHLEVKQKETKWTNEDVILDWKAYDNESGIKEVILPNADIVNKLEGEHTVTQNGIYTFLAYDKIGNGVMVKHEVKNIDKTAPTLDLSTKQDDNGNIKIIWKMTDTQSGTRNIVLPNGRTTSDASGEYTVMHNGTYSFIAYDNVGNDIIMKVVVSDIDKEGIIFQLWQEEIDENYYKIMWEVSEDQNDFKNIRLPDSTYSTEKQGHYIVDKKGRYTFLAYDMSGNETKGSITIE